MFLIIPALLRAATLWPADAPIRTSSTSCPILSEPLSFVSSGPLALWPSGPLALWPSGPLALWPSGPPALWPSGPPALRPSGLSGLSGLSGSGSLARWLSVWSLRDLVPLFFELFFADVHSKIFEHRLRHVQETSLSPQRKTLSHQKSTKTPHAWFWLSGACGNHTIRLETNSNDFGVLGINWQVRIRFSSSRFF